MLDRAMIEGLVKNGAYHIIYQIETELACYECGNLLRANRFRAVDGTIESVMDSGISIRTLEGNAIIVGYPDIIRIESYDPTQKAGNWNNSRKRGGR
jgi:hypothetical protein